MPFNGTGAFTTLGYPDYPAQSGTTIRASQFNNNIQDLVNGLTNCLTRDGQSPPTQNLPMAGKRHTGVGAATGAGEYARYDQVIDPTVGGTISVNNNGTALQITQAGTGAALVITGRTSVNSTESVKLPSGTTAQRPTTPSYGEFRFNSTLTQAEWWNGIGWVNMGGGATGAPGNAVFVENDITVTGNYTITTNKNAMSAGPITINDGVTVTIPDGSNWVIIG